MLTAYVDIESIFYILMEVLKKQGMTDEVKNTCLEICDLLFSSSLLITLKARLFPFCVLLTLDCLLSSIRCLPSNLAGSLFSKRSSHSPTNPVSPPCFPSPTESLEEFYKFLMNQNNEFWSDVIEDYRGVLLSLHQTLTSMKREFPFLPLPPS